MLTDGRRKLIGKLDRTVDDYEYLARENAKGYNYPLYVLSRVGALFPFLLGHASRNLIFHSSRFVSTTN